MRLIEVEAWGLYWAIREATWNVLKATERDAWIGRLA